MVIKPGTHTLRVRYWVKDVATNVEGTITKIYPSKAYASNTYYDMTANLNVRDYDGDHYYGWDAQQQYWYGYEWTKNLAGNTGQPTQNNGNSSNYPKNNTDSRYYHEGSGAFQATQSCDTLPNVNELTWYAAYGEPRWDADELWTTMGHLYRGGMWFKKKSVLQAEGHYNSNTAVDGTDWRTNANENNWPASQTPPSAADAGNYFYLPALGFYSFAKLINLGIFGHYWSSSATPSSSIGAYYMYFTSGNVYVINYPRYVGFRVGGFE